MLEVYRDSDIEELVENFLDVEFDENINLAEEIVEDDEGFTEYYETIKIC